MAHSRSADTRIWAAALAIITLITAVLCCSRYVYSADDSAAVSETSSAVSVISDEGAAAAQSADNTNESKSMDPFSFLFGFLVPVGAVTVFLIFFIVTRTARLKKRHSEAKRRLSDGNDPEGAANDN